MYNYMYFYVLKKPEGLDIVGFLVAVQACGIALREVSDDFESQHKSATSTFLLKTVSSLEEQAPKAQHPAGGSSESLWSRIVAAVVLFYTTWSFARQPPLFRECFYLVGKCGLPSKFTCFSSILCMYDTTSSRNHHLMYVMTITASRREFFPLVSFEGKIITSLPSNEQNNKKIQLSEENV